jgi:hypothetical protein
MTDEILKTIRAALEAAKAARVGVEYLPGAAGPSE